MTAQVARPSELESVLPLAATAVADVIALIQRLSFARSTSEVMDVVRHGARRLVGADGITFVLRDGEYCFYAEEDAVAPLWKGKRFPLETCISGWAMLHRESVAIADIFADPRIPHEAYRPTFVRSLAMVPVRREDPVAAIGAYWAEMRQPAAEEVMVLEMVANAAAVAITNVGLNSSLEAALRQEEARSAELRRVQARLEAANQAKSRFLAAICHDLSQPLQGMRLFHQLLCDKFADQGQERIFTGMEAALSVGERLLKATQQVAALEAGLVTPVIEALDLNDMLTSLAAEFAAEAAAKGLSVRVVPTLRRVLSDPARLEDMLRALVANAIRFTASGRVVLGVRRAGNAARIVVADSGIGLSPADQEAVFEDFYQVGNSARDCRHGFGLGLGVVRRTAELLGHSVAVSSRLGRGSVFSVTVPAA